jgi:C-5 cytosine-specific DNA methylase
MKPLAIDLFCGLGGWAEGLLTEGWQVIGFDIERHVYGEHRYPAQLVIQDVVTLHGSQFRDADLIVASPPCQAYSYRAMPWSRAKVLPPPDNTLFEACFRIQGEACEAAGQHIPLIVENVRGAQKWVGRARWAGGSICLWGDVPCLMPTLRHVKVGGLDWNRFKNKAPGYRGEAFNTRIATNKRASALLTAKIPLPLARHIGAVFLPR